MDDGGTTRSAHRSGKRLGETDSTPGSLSPSSDKQKVFDAPNFAFGNYLADCFCRGLRDTLSNINVPANIFRHDELPKMCHAVGRPISISPELAHEIILGSI